MGSPGLSRLEAVGFWGGAQVNQVEMLSQPRAGVEVSCQRPSMKHGEKVRFLCSEHRGDSPSPPPNLVTQGSSLFLLLARLPWGAYRLNIKLICITD